MVPYKGVHASKGKVARAEPVAALYEQGRVRHARVGLDALEDQMCLMTARGYDGKGSPDRVDALVWALHDLMIEPAARWRRPQLRAL
jgi:phage terminase large subunit-like protein